MYGLSLVVGLLKFMRNHPMARKDARDLPPALLLQDGTYQRTFRDINNIQQPTKEYDHWHHMQTRCKPNYWVTRPTYTGYQMSEMFSDYNQFVKWCQAQPVAYQKGFTLEKDLLNAVAGTKVYSEDTCAFVPVEVNGFLGVRNSRVKHYTGVSFQQSCKKFIVSCSQLNGKNKTLGRFLCPEEAYSVYREEKVRLAGILANKYAGLIDHRITLILSSFDLYIDKFTINPTNKE